MAFSGSSYFAGIGTAFAAIAVGFAGGAMVTTRAVEPPNRLERLNSATTVGSNSGATRAAVTSPKPEQANAAKPASQDTSAPTVAAAPAADPQPASQPQAAAPAAAKPDTATAVRNVQEQPTAGLETKNPAPAPAARSDDAAAAKTAHANIRSAETNSENSPKKAERKSSDRRRLSERRRRQDDDPRQQNLDATADVVHPLPPRGSAVDEIVEQDPPPRFGGRQRHFEMFGEDDSSPRMIDQPPPPRFGFFGD